MSKLTLPNGSFIVGILSDVQSQPWTNDPNKFNHRLHVINQYMDSYGYQQTEHTNIDINATELQKYQQFCNVNKGSQVLVPVVNNAKVGGKNGAWLSRYVPKDSEIIILNTAEQLAKAA